MSVSKLFMQNCMVFSNEVETYNYAQYRDMSIIFSETLQYKRLQFAFHDTLLFLRQQHK